jgi:hypothetical protein
MPELLIHSMSEFSEIVLSVLGTSDVRNIVEIGAEYGGNTAMLADFVGERNGTLISVDPAPKPEFVAWAAAHPNVSHIALPSLQALPELGDVDAWIIDGDHNWYTVFNELVQIDALNKRNGKPLLAILHDVNWPSGRRDMYYAPDAIPEPFRHPHSFDAGCFPGAPDLVEGQGFRGMGHFAWARHEGGPRNGVLTAIEDFMEEQHRAGRELGFAEIPAVFGLGVLFDLDAEWSGRVAEAVLPYHDNKLLRTLEQNRLQNYLRVIELQDAALQQNLAA